MGSLVGSLVGAWGAWWGLVGGVRGVADGRKGGPLLGACSTWASAGSGGDLGANLGIWAQRGGGVFGGVFGGDLGGVVGGRGATWWWSSCPWRLRQEDIQEAPRSKGKTPPLGFLLLQAHESRSRELAVRFRRQDWTEIGSQMAIWRNLKPTHRHGRDMYRLPWSRISTCGIASQPPCRDHISIPSPLGIQLSPPQNLWPSMNPKEQNDLMRGKRTKNFVQKSAYTSKVAFLSVEE